MDHFLNEKPSGSTFNLTRENLKDINFNLQGFVVEEENILDESLTLDIFDDSDDEPFNFNDVLNTLPNESFKMWCVNEKLWPVSAGLSLMKNEARKLLFKTLNKLQME